MSSAPPPPAVIEHDALAAGTRFGEFEIKRVHGVGGFGIVYLAWDHSLEREVALKEYMPATLASRGAGEKITVRSASYAETFAIGLRSFMNEARLLARFDHPSLVKVYRFWEDNATAYMVMPFLRGVTLRDTRRRMGHPPDEAWIRSVVLPILSALELLHREGVYHRDIAPDNILLPPDGPPILLDFGAARRVISDRTQSLTAILKPSYAPIEQYAEMAQLRQGPWTDLYALGAVVHYLLFGAPPAPATARAVQDETDAIEQRVVAGVSPQFMRTVAWMLAVRPNQRPQNAEALRAVLDGRAAPPAPGTVVAPTTRPPLPAAPPVEPAGTIEGETRVQSTGLPTHPERTAGLAPGVDSRLAPGGTRVPADGAPPAPTGSSAPASTTLPPVERTAGLAPTLARPGSYSPRALAPMPPPRTIVHDGDATRIEGAPGGPTAAPPGTARATPTTLPPSRADAAPSTQAPGRSDGAPWTQPPDQDAAPWTQPPSRPEAAPPRTQPPSRSEAAPRTQPPVGSRTQPPPRDDGPSSMAPPARADGGPWTQPPARPDGAPRTQPPARGPTTQPPPTPARPPVGGSTQPPWAGDGSAAGATPRTQPPPGSSRPAGITLPPGAGRTQPPPSTFGLAQSATRARSPIRWIAGTVAAVVAAVAVGAWVAGRRSAETPAAVDPGASAAAAAASASTPSATVPPVVGPTTLPAVAAPSSPTAPGTATALQTPVATPPGMPAAGAELAVAASAASGARVRPPRSASAVASGIVADPALAGAQSGWPRVDAASAPSAADRARAAQAAASARDAARPPAPVATASDGASTLVEACGSKSFISKYRCEEERCEDARFFRANPGCELILNRKRQREYR